MEVRISINSNSTVVAINIPDPEPLAYVIVQPRTNFQSGRAHSQSDLADVPYLPTRGGVPNFI